MYPSFFFSLACKLHPLSKFKTVFNYLVKFKFYEVYVPVEKQNKRNYFNNFPEKGEGLLYVHTRDI